MPARNPVRGIAGAELDFRAVRSGCVASGVGTIVVRYPRKCDLCGKTVKLARLNVCNTDTMKTVVDLQGCSVQVRIGTGRGARLSVEDNCICRHCLSDMAIKAIAVLDSYYEAGGA